MSVRRRPIRVTAVWMMAAAAVVVNPGCAAEALLPAPGCVSGDTALLVAQSAPSAQMVPCFDSIPAGWDVVAVSIDQDGTLIRFDSDRAGDEAAVFRYEEECELGAAVGAPSEFDGVDRYEDVEQVAPSFRAKRFYVFDGGCAWWEFDFDADATAALSIELGERLSLVARAELNESIRETFIDEDV